MMRWLLVVCVAAMTAACGRPGFYRVETQPSIMLLTDAVDDRKPTLAWIDGACTVVIAMRDADPRTASRQVRMRVDDEVCRQAERSLIARGSKPQAPQAPTLQAPPPDPPPPPPSRPPPPAPPQTTGPRTGAQRPTEP